MGASGRQTMYLARQPSLPRHRDTEVQSGYSMKVSWPRLPPCGQSWCRRDKRRNPTWCNSADHVENRSLPWFVDSKTTQFCCEQNPDCTGKAHVLNKYARLRDRQSKPKSCQPQDGREAHRELSVYLLQDADQCSTSSRLALRP